MFFKKMRASFGQSQPVSDPNNWIFRILGHTAKGVPTVNQNTALNIPAVYRGISLISNSLGQLPAGVYRNTEAGRVAIKDHPLNKVLSRQANEFMTAFTARQTVQHHAVAWGNGYFEIERNNKGQTIGLWPLLPDRTKVEKDDNNKLQYNTIIDDNEYLLPGENVLHIKSLGFTGYEGLSAITLHRMGLGIAVSAEEFGAKFFSNDMKSGGFLTHPGKLSDKAKENLKDAKNAQGGLENAHRVKLLEEGMKFVQTTIPPEDAQFLGTRTFQIEEVARMLGVPPILLYSMEKTTSWGTGIEQLMIGFITLDMQPWIIQWEQEMTNKLFTKEELDKGYYIKFNLKGLLRGDMSARGEFYNKMFNTGSMNSNDIRENEDQNHYAEGYQYRVPSNTVPAGTPAPNTNKGVVTPEEGK